MESRDDVLVPISLKFDGYPSETMLVLDIAATGMEKGGGGRALV